MDEGVEVSEPSLVYTIDQALSAMGFRKFQGFVLAYAGLGWVAKAMEMMILSFVGPAVKYEWALSPSEESLITTAVFAGMLLGAYSWGLISDHFGRRKGLLSIAIVTSGAGFPSVFSPNYVSLVILRCLVGFGLGGGPAYSSWFLEFVPAPNRGTWMVIFSTFWTFGTVLEASLAWIIMPRLNWRWLLAVSSVPSFMALLFYGPTPESPRAPWTRFPWLILVDRIGRKLSMVIMFALGCIFLLPLVFHQKEILTCLLCGVRMCIMGTITVANIYAPEIYPTSIRATGFGLVSAVGRIGGMICPLVAVGLVTGCHQTAAILLFEAVMIVSGVSVMLLPLETNGRELTDIVAVPE